MQVLINIPNLNKPGGVAALFNILKLEQCYPNVSLFVLHNNLPSIFRIPYKYLEFIFKMIITDVVHLNPSLNAKSFFRDGLFAWIALLFKKKLIVYWHGWDEIYESKIKNSKFLTKILKNTFFKAHSTIVLGRHFEGKLRDIGYKHRIYIETNTAENRYLKIQRPKSIRSAELINLLFLSRLEVDKGLYIAVETLKFLNQKSKRYRLVIAGSGKEEENIVKLSLEDSAIVWAGYAQGQYKHNLLTSAHFLFLPSYSEGLPLCILEGMMYGLPIISRPIGGIPDIVNSNENGCLIEELDFKKYAEKIIGIVSDPDLYYNMSRNNIYKSGLFAPEVVRKRYYQYYRNLYEGR